MERAFVALRALTFMSGAVLLWVWVALQVRTFDQSLDTKLPSWVEIPGVVVMMLGGLLALLCVGLFVLKGRGTPAPFDSPKALVAAGPYKVVRNPMYLGVLSLLFGFALYQRSWSILLFSFAWLFLAHLFVLHYEEPTLRRKFGAAYDAYSESVPRWIPKWTQLEGTARS